VRLACWHGGALLVLSLALGLVLDAGLRHKLRQQADDRLDDELAEFSDLDFLAEPALAQADLDREAQARGTHRVGFAVWDARGELLLHSPLQAWPDWDHPPAAIATLPARQHYRETTTRSGDTVARCVYTRLDDGRVVGIGHAWHEERETMRRFRTLYAWAVGLLVLGAGTLAWAMARRALAGVARVTAAASRAATGELTQRVPLTGQEGREIAELARAFNEMLDRIERLVAELSDVTNNLAHDLRSPLSRLRTAAETALTAPADDPRREELLAMVIEESERLVGMVNTMLEIARSDAGVTQLQRQPHDLGTMCSEAFSLFEPLFEDRGLVATYHPAATPISLAVDGQRLQRALANLLDNAAKYTAPGGRIDLTLQATPDAVEIIVADTGCGISPVDLPRVFDRFYRGDSSRSSPGSGLGLTLARAYVLAHGGVIAARSTPGLGSTFTIRLPRPPA
jgi:heavy metal sensor kinase